MHQHSAHLMETFGVKLGVQGLFQVEKTEGNKEIDAGSVEDVLKNIQEEG